MLMLGHGRFFDKCAGLSFVHCFVVIAAVNAIKPPYKVIPRNQIGAANDSTRQLPGADGSAKSVFAQMDAVFSGSLNGFLHVQNIQIHISFSSLLQSAGLIPLAAFLVIVQ